MLRKNVFVDKAQIMDLKFRTQVHLLTIDNKYKCKMKTWKGEMTKIV